MKLNIYTILFLLILIFSLKADEKSDKELQKICISKTTEDSCMTTKGCSWFPPDNPNGKCDLKNKKGYKEKKKATESKSEN